MKINQAEAMLLVSKLEDSANDYDFNWRLYAKLCIAAGQKDKFRDISKRISQQYEFPFVHKDVLSSGQLTSIFY